MLPEIDFSKKVVFIATFFKKDPACEYVSCENESEADIVEIQLDNFRLVLDINEEQGRRRYWDIVGLLRAAYRKGANEAREEVREALGVVS